MIAQCLRIEATQRILLEDVLRHPWMRQEMTSELPMGCSIPPQCPNETGGGLSFSTGGTNSSQNSSSTCCSEVGGVVGLGLGNSNSNQHKPSLNSVGSCISTSTSDECTTSSSESPAPEQHIISMKTASKSSSRTTGSSLKLRLRPPNSAPQTLPPSQPLPPHHEQFHWPMLVSPGDEEAGKELQM